MPVRTVPALLSTCAGPLGAILTGSTTPDPSTKPFRKWEEPHLPSVSFSYPYRRSICGDARRRSNLTSLPMRNSFDRCVVPTHNGYQLLRKRHKDQGKAVSGRFVANRNSSLFQEQRLRSLGAPGKILRLAKHRIFAMRSPAVGVWTHACGLLENR